jgi:2,4-dienoyl-CoA reductase-like NADH-dependent reductase (Old Yellow Enzyme family)
LISLLDPIKIKGVKLKNRIVMPPMNTEYATTDGTVTAKLIEHYRKRAGNLGLLIIEHAYIHPHGRLSKRQLGIYHGNLIPGLKHLATSLKATGTPVIAQINHAGSRTTTEMIGTRPVAPSKRGKARRLTIDEIQELTEAFATAAERAVRAGFDGVEIHGAHGFLLNQFYSPLRNKRSDRYGGTLQKRIRFPLEVVEAVKQKTGRKLLLYRIGADDMNPAGTTVKDSQKFAKKLEKAEVDIIDISGGLSGSRPEGLQKTQGYFIPQAHQVKKAVTVPVIGVGGITEPEYANKIIRERKVDLVAVGRALLKDPEWATKAIQTLKTRK